jgi:hypothetical protein
MVEGDACRRLKIELPLQHGSGDRSERTGWAVRVREFGKELSVGTVRAVSGFRQFRSSLTSSPASRSNTMIEFFVWGALILGQALYWSFFRDQTELVSDQYWKAYLLRYRIPVALPLVHL